MQEECKKVKIFCAHTSSNQHPNGIRHINIARILNSLGYEVTVYGIGTSENQVYACDDIICYDWKPFYSKNVIIRSNKINKYMISKLTDALKDLSIGDIIISAFGSEKPKYRKFIRDYAHKNHITFMESIVEWYNIYNYTLKYKYRFFINELTMRYGNKSSKSIISISTFLADYYAKQKCNTIYIPTLIDKEEYKDCKHNKNDRLTIMYAGSPGKKDCILNAIYALGQLSDEELKKIRFVIFGVTESKLKQLGLTDEFLNKVGDALEIRGRIPQEEVKGNIASADYTVLLRKNTRNANAGFSTKVGESMACGTPVIANYTGDLDKYIFDEKTGLVCPNESIESCASVYRKALAMTEEQYMNMRENAQKTAFESFDYREYTDLLKEFIKKAKR